MLSIGNVKFNPKKSLFGSFLYNQFSCSQLEMWNSTQRNIYLGRSFTINSHVLNWKCEIQPKDISIFWVVPIQAILMFSKNERKLFLLWRGTKKPSYISGFTINSMSCFLVVKNQENNFTFLYTCHCMHAYAYCNKPSDSLIKDDHFYTHMHLWQLEGNIWKMKGINMQLQKVVLDLIYGKRDVFTAPNSNTTIIVNAAFSLQGWKF